jgi:hypothetical protein
VDPAELAEAEGRAVADVVVRQRAARLGEAAATWLQGLAPTMVGDEGPS